MQRGRHDVLVLEREACKRLADRQLQPTQDATRISPKRGDDELAMTCLQTLHRVPAGSFETPRRGSLGHQGGNLH